MEIKTCEEYVIREFENAKEMISALLERNKELTEKLEQRSIEELPEEELPKSKTYTISEQPNWYYSFYCASYGDINIVLQKNNKTPEFLKKVLENDEAYEEYIKLHSDSGYNTYYGGDLRRSEYVFLFVNFYGKTSVIYDSYDKTSGIVNIDNKNYFLDIEKAKEKMKEVVFEKINDYFRYKYNEKFKPEVENKDGE